MIDIPNEYIPLWLEALKWMNAHDFDRYLSWNDERFKTKWDIVKYNEFQSYHGGTVSLDEHSSIGFEPNGLKLSLNRDKSIFIPIEKCKKEFENQGKTIIRQESLF